MRIEKRNFEKKITNKHAKTNKYEKMPNKKGNRQTSVFQICNSSINLSFREVVDREDKRKRETHVSETKKIEEKKKRQQMNKCISKGHIAERMRVKKDKLKSFVIQKEIAVQKNRVQEKKRSRKSKIKHKRK